MNTNCPDKARNFEARLQHQTHLFLFMLLGLAVVYILGILYAVDAKFHILIKIYAPEGSIGSSGPNVVLRADITTGPVRVALNSL